MLKRLAVLGLAIVIVISLAFAVYKIAGSPPIPLPIIPITVDSTSPIADLMQKAGTDELTVTWVTDGDMSIVTQGNHLADITYSMGTLGNTVDVAEEVVLARSEWWMKLIYLPVKLNAAVANAFFYYVIPVEITIVIKS